MTVFSVHLEGCNKVKSDEFMISDKNSITADGDVIYTRRTNQVKCMTMRVGWEINILCKVKAVQDIHQFSAVRANSVNMNVKVTK